MERSEDRPHPPGRASRTALSKCPQGGGESPEEPGRVLMICPGSTPIPELDLISSKPAFSGEDLTRGSWGGDRLRFHPLVSAGAQEAGGLRLPLSPTSISGSARRFPSHVVCPGEELKQQQQQ